jgi:hypothetical protein
LEFSFLDSTKANWLERPFQEEEVLQVFLSMDGDKALFPNNFNIAFFWSCWAIVKDDLMRVFHNFHEHEVLHSLLLSLKRLGSWNLRISDPSA